MNKNPWVAAILNMFLFGGGYIYNGKRVGLGYALVLAVLLIRFGEISIQYSSRLGETKLNAWRDGFQNLAFLLKKRFLR